MRLIDRYIVRELFTPFLIGTVAVTLMFDANMVIALEKNLDLSAVNKVALIQDVLYRTPEFLNMTLPVGMALAGSLAMSRLARETELTAMRSAGASILRAILPIAFFGILVSIANFLVVEKVMPVSSKRAESLERQIGVLVAVPTIAENTYIKLDRYQVSIGSAAKAGDGLNLHDVAFFTRPRLGTVVIGSAKEGAYRNGLWSFSDARFWSIQDDVVTRYWTKDDFQIDEKIVLADLMMMPSPQQLSLSQLHDAIVQAHREGRKANQLEVQWHVRFAIPFSCLIFAFVAPALAIAFSRTGAFAGVLLSIFLVFLYYNAFVISTEILGRNGTVPGWLAAWLPNFLFAIIGFFAIRRLE